MLYNVFKMIVVRLLLFSVLLYNTEAVYNDYDWYGETQQKKGVPVINVPIPVEDTNTTDWYYGSYSVDKNETRYHYTDRDEDKRPIPDNKTTDWYYGSDSVNKNKPRHNVSTSVKEQPAVSEKKANVMLTVPKPYSDDVKNVVSSSYETYFDLLKKITKARRVPLHSKPTTETSYYRYNKSLLGYATPTPITPYYRYGVKKTVDDKSKTAVLRNGYNKPVVNFETTNTSEPYYLYGYDKLEISATTPEVSHYQYNKSVIGYETPTTETRNYLIMGEKYEVPKSKPAVPYYGYNKTVEELKPTTSTISDYKDWRNANNTTTPRNLWYNEKRPSFEVGTTSVTEDYITTADAYKNWVVRVFPFVIETNSSDRNLTTDQVNPKTPNSHRDPVKISINSSVNGNEARNYGAFADLLKKMAGYILPNTSNIAPNSNVTNLAVANGNGNVFFYMG